MAIPPDAILLNILSITLRKLLKLNLCNYIIYNILCKRINSKLTEILRILGGYRRTGASPTRCRVGLWQHAKSAAVVVFGPAYAATAGERGGRKAAH